MGVSIIREATAADAEAIARVHVDSWRESYAGLMPAEFLAGLSCEKNAEAWKTQMESGNRGIVLVAEEEGQGIVGFACGGRSRSEDAPSDGEIFAIYLLRAFHGRGIGSALFAALVENLAAAGFRELHAWALEGNAEARRFYERNGGARLPRTKVEFFGGAPLREAAYFFRV